MTKKLNDAQRDTLIEQYSEIVVDSMDMQDLIQYAQEQLANYLDTLSDSELKEEVGNYDEELYDELVDNVTQQYPKQLNTFEKETFIDINNTGGKF
tara:strand:- start:158 stop:445 length:288 start_codon:yes stop_codon:yes gene_type:complete